jgi:hypothetical protein
MISKRSGSDRFFSFGGSTDEMLMPSSSNSASARTTSPTLAPSYSTEASSTPFGWRAPAARHVQLPSSRTLVSSTSILWDMTLAKLQRDHPGLRRACRGNAGSPP